MKEHAVESAKVCSEVNLDFIRLRTLVVQHGSFLEGAMNSGKYKVLSPSEKLKEVKILIENLEVNKCELASDHFTNNLWVENKVIYRGIYGTLPKEKNDMLKILDYTLDFLSKTKGEILDSAILYEKGFINSL